MRQGSLFSSPLVRLLLIVFLGLHVPLTLLALAVLLLAQTGPAVLLGTAFLGTLVAALITLPLVYRLAPGVARATA